MTRDIALIEPDPGDWEWWMKYLLERLEEEAKRRRRGLDFNSLLNELVNDLQKRGKK